MHLQPILVDHLPTPCLEAGKDFEVLYLHHIPHADNVVVDDLSTKVSTWALVLDGVFERRLL
jgi:hypothetical protein